MPITLNYQPAAESIYGSAYSGKAGQALRENIMFARQQALREAQFVADQQARQQQAFQNQQELGLQARQQMLREAQDQRNFTYGAQQDALDSDYRERALRQSADLQAQQIESLDRRQEASFRAAQDQDFIERVNRGILDPYGHLDPATQAAMRAGKIAYTQHDQQEIQNINSAIGTLDRDSSLTPLDRARMQAELIAKRNTYRPVPLPPNPGDQTTGEIISGKIAPFQIPGTGIEIPMTQDRSGRPTIAIKGSDMAAFISMLPPEQRFRVDSDFSSKEYNEMAALMAKARADENAYLPEDRRKPVMPTPDEIRQEVAKKHGVPVEVLYPNLNPQALPAPDAGPPSPAQGPVAAPQGIDPQDAAMFDAAVQYEQFLPGVRGDVEWMAQVLAASGGDANLPNASAADRERFVRLNDRIGNFTQTINRPMQLPAPENRDKLITYGVYGPLRGPDGKLYSAMWDGEKFIPVSEWREASQ